MTKLIENRLRKIGMISFRKILFIFLSVFVILAFSYFTSTENAVGYVIVGGVGIFLLAIIFLRPYMGIVLMLCLLPFEVFTVLPANLKAFTSITSLFGLAALVCFILRNKESVFESRKPDKYIYVFFALLLVVIILGEVLKPISTGISYPFTYIQLIILVWLSGRLFKTPQQIETLMKFFIISNVAAATISLQDFDLYSSSSEINRLSGFQGGANEFAVYLSISIVMIIYFSMTTKRTINRIILIITTIFLVIPTIYSGSRGAILFLVPVIALQLWQFRNNKIFLVIIGLTTSIAVLGAIGPYLPLEYTQRISSIPQDIFYGSDTVGLRYGLWQYGVELWWQRPILGIGSGMFSIFSIDSPVLHGIRMLPLHNTYLTHLVENGIIGLLFFSLIIIRSMLNYSRVIRVAGKNSSLRNLAITCQAIMLLILLNGVKGDWNTNKLLWICIALSMVTVSLQRKVLPTKILTDSRIILSTKSPRAI